MGNMPYKKEGTKEVKQASVLLMEYAPHGSLYDLLIEREA